MRAPHLLRVAQEPACFAPLLTALAAAGLRSGWLELRRPAELPASLEAAAALGAARAVAAGDGRSLAVKALRGAPVLRDLLREHFAGCALVLVAMDSGSAAPAGPVAGAPELRAAGERWRVTLPPKLANAADEANAGDAAGAAEEARADAASEAGAAGGADAASAANAARAAEPARGGRLEARGGIGANASTTADAANAASAVNVAPAGDGAGELFDTAHLVSRLRRSRPWATGTAEAKSLALAPGDVGTGVVSGGGGET